MRIRYRNSSYSIRQMFREIIPAVIIMAAVVFMTACAGNGRGNVNETNKGITAGVSADSNSVSDTAGSIDTGSKSGSNGMSDNTGSTDSTGDTSSSDSGATTATPGNEINDNPAASQDNSANNSDASADNTESQNRITDPGIPVSHPEAAYTVPTDIPVIEKSISFSLPSGFYPEEFDLELGIASDAAAPEGSGASSGHIFFTLDGSDPAQSHTAIEYTSAIRIYAPRSVIRDNAVVPGPENIASAVDPLLFSGNYSAVGPVGYNFVSTVSTPDESAADKCTVIRAALRYADGSFGPESGAVYFIGIPSDHIPGIAESCSAAGYPLSVISIATAHDGLFDNENGIYVKGKIFDDALNEYISANGRIKDGEVARSLDANYKQHGKAWELKASVTMFEADGSGAAEVISQVCGLRVQGNYSRSDLQKGFRLYARGEYGKKNFKYPVFGAGYTNAAGEVMDRFDTLVLRAGGNCAFTAKFSDVFWQSLLGNSNCETQRSRPCVVYLNGEYWGLYVLQEDYSDDWFEDKYGVDKDSVVIYKGDAEKYASGYKLDEGTLPEGALEDYYFSELEYIFSRCKDLSSDEDYEAFCRIVDEESVMDYFAAECWINNKWDWPGKNWSMWKAAPTDDYDGRWRFMFYDMEFGGVSGSSDAKTNTVKEDNYKPEGLLDRGTNNPAVLCFAWLMTNKGFKDRFCARLTALSESCFEKETALARLAEYEAIYAPLYDQFFARYPGSGSTDNAVNGGYASIRCIRDFLNGRAGNIYRLTDYINKKR